MIAFLVKLVEDRALTIATAGALAVVAGSAAPWAHVPQGALGTITELGLDADGKITLLLGVLALGLVAAHAFLRHRDLLVGAAVAAAGSAAYAIVYALDVRRASQAVTARMLQTSPDAVDVRFEASTGIGVWTVVAGAVVLAAACIVLLARPGEAKPGILAETMMNNSAPRPHKPKRAKKRTAPKSARTKSAPRARAKAGSATPTERR